MNPLSCFPVVVKGKLQFLKQPFAAITIGFFQVDLDI